MGKIPKRFRIAFSFAGEKRKYVAKIADILAKRFDEAAILYDKFHEAEFAHPDLAFSLPDLYRNETDLIVAVFCKDYERKEWCGLEWRAAFALIKEGKRKQIMLSRFERVEGKGLQGLAGFIELDDKTPEQAAKLILERLALNEGKPKYYYFRRNPGHKSGGGLTASSSRELPGPNHPIHRCNHPRLQSFFGREDELKKIADALAPEARTWGALIDGPGGMGKTSLAIRAAELTQEDRFARIVFLSSKERALTPEGEKQLTGFVQPGYVEMLNQLAAQIGQPDIAKSLEDERAGLVLRALQANDALLILDNLESLPPGDRDRIYTLLSRLPGRCKAIVTSRRRTDIDARIVRLDKLGEKAALDYIAALAEGRPHLLKATPVERRNLYIETGGNPLLIRWVAGQLGRGKCRTVAAALAFLRSAPPGNDPLEFIFGDLLDTFTSEETKALAALTHFGDQVEVKFIAELGGLSQAAAQMALEDLADRALIVSDAEAKHFGIVRLVADFLRRAYPEAVRQTGDRLTDHAYALVVENGWEHYHRFQTLDDAWPTIVAALPIFLLGSNDWLQTICDALRRFLDFTGRWDEWLTLSLEAESKACAAKDFLNARRRAYDCGWAYVRRGQPKDVLACADRVSRYDSAVMVSARDGAVALHLRGAGCLLSKQHAAALAAFKGAVDLWRTSSPESAAIAIGLSSLANAERLAGNGLKAERDYNEALRIARTVGYHHGIASTIGGLAEVALDRKDWVVAETLAREALRLSRRLRRKELIAADCRRLAQGLVQQGRKLEALPYVLRAVDIYTSLRLPDLEDAHGILAECGR